MSHYQRSLVLARECPLRVLVETFTGDACHVRRGGRAEEIGRTTGIAFLAGERLQMFARIGYGAATPPVPRWPLETRIKGT